jgi:hypothetical protein
MLPLRCRERERFAAARLESHTLVLAGERVQDRGGPVKIGSCRHFVEHASAGGGEAGRVVRAAWC